MSLTTAGQILQLHYWPGLIILIFVIVILMYIITIHQPTTLKH